MSFVEALAEAKIRGDYQSMLQAVPYACLIGVDIIEMGEELVFRLPAQKDNIGNPTLPAIHGGVIGGFLENAAIFHVLLNIDCEQMPRVVDFSLDYLRPGRYLETYASCELVRQGRKVANVTVTAWQERRSKPVANARTHLLL